jgi:hypothetical protein
MHFNQALLQSSLNPYVEDALYKDLNPDIEILLRDPLNFQQISRSHHTDRDAPGNYYDVA